MKRIKILGAFIALALIVGCTSSPSSSQTSKKEKQPGWITDINSVYPDNEYLAVLGEGDSLSKAQAKAASNMALIFESRIVVDNTVESRYVEMRSGGVLSGKSEETAVSDNISQLSDQTLQNVKFGESWTNSMGTVVVAAYMNRRETADLYKTRMDEQSRVIGRLKNLGDKGTSRIERYAYYDSAYIIAMGNEIMREQLEIISPMTAKTAGMGYDLSEIKTARTSSADDMTFRMNFEGDDDGKAQSSIAETLTNMGFTVSERGDIAVSGSLRSEKIERANDYKNFKWYLMIDIVDEEGMTIISVNESGISASTSESAAKSRVNVDVNKVINKEFEKQFNGYINSFIDK